MAKSFVDVVQDSHRTGLGIPVKTKKPPHWNQYPKQTDSSPERREQPSLPETQDRRCRPRCGLI